MREIKFRAWDESNKKFLDQNEFNIRIDSGALQNNHCKGIIGGIELMQYTGLKDKNGKEIYEGDIVIINTKNTNFEYIEEIVFEDYSFYSKRTWNVDKKGLEKRSGLSSLMPDNFNYEIIGNLYENPELLNQ